MKLSSFWTAVSSIGVVALASTPALADKLGDHPAVVVQRLHATSGYDYASKFYPHPAWLHLLAEQPHRMNHHPAVTLARQQAEARAKAVDDARALLASVERR